MTWRVPLCLAGLAFGPAALGQVATAYTTLVVQHSGKCVRILGDSGGGGPGAAAMQYGCEGANQDSWTLEPVGTAFRIVQRGSRQCLSVQGAMLGDDAPVQQLRCEDRGNQLWNLVREGAVWRLRALHSGRCLDVRGGSLADSARMVQSSCRAVPSQAFVFSSRMFDPQTPASVVARHSGMCLQVRDGGTAQDTPVVQVPCNGAAAPHERWRLEAEASGWRLIAEHTGQCLSVAGASRSASAAVVQLPCGGAQHQHWRLRAGPRGYQLVASHSGMCLDVEGGSRTSGARLIQYGCHSRDNQRWHLALPTQPALWSGVIPLSIVPVAAAHLPDGRLLTWSAYDRLNFGGDYGYTYTVFFDPVTATGSERLVSETSHDMFCPGIANLADGRILVNGGSSTARTSIYDPASNSWSAEAPMNIGRGYQGTTLMSDGSVLTLGGSWSGGMGGKDGERWKAGEGWVPLPGVPVGPILADDPEGIYRADNHLWLLTMAGGRVLHAGPSPNMNWIDGRGQGSITSAGRRADDPYSMNGTASLYNVGRILTVGGAPAYQRGLATANAHVIEHNGSDLSVRRTASMAYTRGMHNSVVLPNGEVVVIGGVAVPASFTDARSVLVPELWDPRTETFSRLPPMRTPRNYHSVALLLTDGRVFAGGGGLCGSCPVNHPNAEILTPPYLLNADGSPAARPSITAAPATAALGASINVSTDGPVPEFALIRMSSVTHTVNNDQRRIPLRALTADGRSYILKLPSDPGVALPGYYMLFALNSQGVPSVARVIRIA
ncbi:RICIN domain-containing protein [Aquabacterium sp. A7-Y]|uniref:RICIN domain-containing protein n=1 Tax=Aquabacterium sp. A7-Y TaxID=1349605 RepID=UPI00223D51A8|nr:RICIN domain-containing protein [Aquabacterium sp. A7-Y]MCW7539109.1 RICIN domain-containing protein [Aquabacterium sp. A7-Y]